jgi:hypothetical protein
MKKLLLLVGITGVLGLVNVATRADAAIQPPTRDTIFDQAAPAGTCVGETCETQCQEAGCFGGICVPVKVGFTDFRCQCINQNGTDCS